MDKVDIVYYGQGGMSKDRCTLYIAHGESPFYMDNRLVNRQCPPCPWTILLVHGQLSLSMENPLCSWTTPLVMDNPPFAMTTPLFQRQPLVVIGQCPPCTLTTPPQPPCPWKMSTLSMDNGGCPWTTTSYQRTT